MILPKVSYSDFAKLDMRVGTIETCEEVLGSKKLLKLTVDLGPELGRRIILSGIKKQFINEVQPRQPLVGLQVLVLANLEPKKMMGMESQGMILMGVEKKFKVQSFDSFDIAQDKSTQDKSVKCKVDGGIGEETEPEGKITLLVPQSQVPAGTGVE